MSRKALEVHPSGPMQAFITMSDGTLWFLDMSSRAMEPWTPVPPLKDGEEDRNNEQA